MKIVSRVATVDVSNCVGCKSCERHCPTGAIKVRAAGCEGYIPPCNQACPAGVNVQGYIALAGAGDYEGAYRLIRQANPFPSVCGRICTHPCQSKCNRGEYDASVAIRDIKRFVSDKTFENGGFVKETPLAKNGKQIAVIGAGPSGLSCAYYLALSGYEVDVFESEKVAGGVLAFGIPEYRLPREILNRDIQGIEDAGVKIHLNTTVGKDVMFDELVKKYHAVYISTGTQFSRHANIPGEDMTGVYHGLDFLKSVNLGEKPKIGKKVVVIGGGNTAIDASRTAVRLGAESVTILYRRGENDMPAERRECVEAFDEGVRVMEMTAPVEILGTGKVEKIKCVKMRANGYDEKHRRKTAAVEGSEFEVEADTVIVAVSQYSDFPFIDKDEIVVSKAGQIVLNEKGMSSMPYVFAGGDVIRGSATAIEAIADGKQAAININAYLGSQFAINVGGKIDIPVVKPHIDRAEVSKMNNLPVAERIKSNDEVATGLTEEQVKTECSRCLGCHGVVSVDQSLCIDCSLCWELCEHGAASMVTLPKERVVTCEYEAEGRTEEIIEICNKAFFRPLDSTCQCTNTPAEEIVRAIMAGAHDIISIHRATGTGGGCGGSYCSNMMYRLLAAAGYPQEDPGDDSYHPILDCLFSLPESSADHDPIIGQDFRKMQYLQWKPEDVEAGNEAYRKFREGRGKNNGQK